MKKTYRTGMDGFKIGDIVVYCGFHHVIVCDRSGLHYMVTDTVERTEDAPCKNWKPKCPALAFLATSLSKEIQPN